MAMKVKRYEAPTLQEALLHVKRDLGSEAVILQTRKFNRGGVFGLLGKNMVEVLAATDIETASSAGAKTGAAKPRAASAGAQAPRIRQTATTPAAIEHSD